MQFHAYISGQVIATLLDPVSFYCKMLWSCFIIAVNFLHFNPLVDLCVSQAALAYIT